VVRPYTHVRTCVREHRRVGLRRFRRALEADSPSLATAAAHELPQLNLADALRLCLVYARADRSRFDRAIVRMNTTTTARQTPSHAKLSATRPDRAHGLAAFVDTCSWVERPADYGGDTWLLALLDERVRWLEAERHGHTQGTVISGAGPGAELPAVGELPAEWIVPIVEDVKARYAGWELAGDDHQRAHDRLDAHFGRRQEAEQLEVPDRQTRDADEARRRADVDREAHEQAVEQTRELYGPHSDPD
jgi:hypothetical protein